MKQTLATAVLAFMVACQVSGETRYDGESLPHGQGVGTCPDETHLTDPYRRFHDGVRDSEGVWRYPDGSSYEGETIGRGVPHGQGVYIFASSNGSMRRYEGRFHKGEFHGKGKLWKGVYDAIGFKGMEHYKPYDYKLHYDGEFCNGEFHGEGDLMYSDGTTLRYKGGFRNGKYDGKGVLMCRDGTTLYDGGFENGEFHGEGILTFPDRGRYDPTDPTLYDGGFRNGKYDGKGVLTFADGTRYKGGFSDNVYHRKGVMTFPDELQIELEFYKNILDGKGSVTYPDGTYQKLEFAWKKIVRGEIPRDIWRWLARLVKAQYVDCEA